MRFWERGVSVWSKANEENLTQERGLGGGAHYGESLLYNTGILSDILLHRTRRNIFKMINIRRANGNEILQVFLAFIILTNVITKASAQFNTTGNPTVTANATSMDNFCRLFRY